MVNDMRFQLGSLLEMKKPHAKPCGSKFWKVIRYGADCKIKCEGCGRIVMIDRVKLKKRIKHVVEE